jgi:hypothetical protein
MAIFVSTINVCSTCAFEHVTVIKGCPSCGDPRVLLTIPRMVADMPAHQKCPDCGCDSGPFTGSLPHTLHCSWK